VTLPVYRYLNLDLYDYKRHMVGLIVRVQSGSTNYNPLRMKAKKAFFGNEAH